MGHFSFEKLSLVWRVWDLRAFVLFSLFLQFFLVFASPHRKRTANGIFTSLIWLAYLLADWAATFAVGLMSHSQGVTSVHLRRSGLMAFWAPFLINHLGGPDTITAFSLEDNELWQRHFLQLIAQLAVTGYVFSISLPDKELWVPTILMFVAGLIKYGERTTSLYLASMDKFRNSLLEEYRERARQKDCCSSYLGHRRAFYYFQTVKGLIVDFIFADEELESSAHEFMSADAQKAFEVVELELNFMHEALYTKMAVIRGRVGYILRLVCFVLVFVSFWLWYSKDKSPYHKSDVKITYTLLGGAIVLDATAFFMLISSSRRISRIKSNYLKYYLPFETSEDKNRKNNPFLQVSAPVRFFHRRWSESIQQFNLVDYCVNARNKNVEKLYEQLGLKEFADGIEYVSEKSLSVELRESIFSQLRDTAVRERPAFSDLGTRQPPEGLVQDKPIYRRLVSLGGLDPQSLSLIKEVGYDEGLVIWHIVTELLCHHSAGVGGDDVCKDDREISKTLSDYMLYLWLWQPKMMTGAVGTNQFKYANTIIRAKEVLESVRLESNDREQRHRKACEKLLELCTDDDENSDGVLRSRSALYPACILTNNLVRIPDQVRVRLWEAVKAVWIDMLSYAAGQCSRNAHAAQLSKGGQLITVVWLMTVHLRLSKQFIVYLNEAEIEARRATEIKAQVQSLPFLDKFRLQLEISTQKSARKELRHSGQPV